MSCFRQLTAEAQHIVICAHVNPDGDALGSSLAMKKYLSREGKDVQVVVPTSFPDFLRWLPGATEVKVYARHEAEVAAVVKASKVPVTVKMRSGWDDENLNAVELAKICEAAGASAITVHGRTRAMLYTGTADWDMIHKVKDQLAIPVIANGDITGGEAAVKCLKRTGADGIMIGRSVFGDPWIFEEVAAAIKGEEYAGRPELKDRIALAVKQFQLSESDHGEHIACLEARKHFAWYLRGVRNASYYKKEITSLKNMEDIYRVAKDIVRDLQ